jgi:acyl transferase domain-containing protein
VDPDDWEGRLVPHQLPDHLPGQVAYRLGLGVAGPVLSVQSACSSSLVATCLAAQSLADYRCDVALVGGVSVTWPRYRHQPDGVVSADGRCRAFDASGQGAGFSSGVGVVVLKRLADAEADGDRVYAVIPGWAIANDGAARAGFAVPGVEGQVAAISEALADAAVHPDEIGLVEAHGSGTPLGDAIEAAALIRAFRAAGASRTGQCALGSVKTSVGHLDAAAGVTSLIKAVLAVHHGRVPGNLHYREPNPEIDLAASPFHVPTKTSEWPTPDRRVAAVNAIGVGGTNAHVLVEQAPRRAADSDSDAGSQHPGPYRLALSGHGPEALREAAARLRGHLIENPDISLADVEHTLATGRRRLAHRMVAECAGVPEAIEALSPERVAENSTPWPVETDGRLVRLPAYPFQRRRHWIEPPTGGVR